MVALPMSVRSSGQSQAIQPTVTSLTSLLPPQVRVTPRELTRRVIQRERSHRFKLKQRPKTRLNRAWPILQRTVLPSTRAAPSGSHRSRAILALLSEALPHLRWGLDSYLRISGDDMHKQLVEEARADVKQNKKVAEENALRALTEAETPRIRDFIDRAILQEVDEETEGNM